MGDGGPRERLFRDDAGAALERLHHLEAENAQLRAELDASRRALRARTPPSRAMAVLLLAVLSALALGATGVAIAWLTSSREAEPALASAPITVRASPPRTTGREMSYESAKVWWMNRPELHKDAAELSDLELTRPLHDGAFVRECGAPETMDVTARVAVLNGAALGVSVYTTPRDPSVTTCIEERLRRLSWPPSPNMGFVTKSY